MREAMVEGRRSWRRGEKRPLEKGWVSLVPGLASKRGDSVRLEKGEKIGQTLGGT